MEVEHFFRRVLGCAELVCSIFHYNVLCKHQSGPSVSFSLGLQHFGYRGNHVDSAVSSNSVVILILLLAAPSLRLQILMASAGLPNSRVLGEQGSLQAGDLATGVTVVVAVVAGVVEATGLLGGGSGVWTTSGDSNTMSLHHPVDHAPGGRAVDRQYCKVMPPSSKISTSPECG